MTTIHAGEVTATIDRFRRRCAVPAVGAALITANEAPTIAAVGQRVRNRPDHVTPQDRWHIGSCAKSMTAALIARLVERGTTHWSATIPELFADLGDRIDRSWNDITLAQLLTHRSGLQANLAHTQLDAAATDPRPITEQRTAAAAGALSRPAREPRSFRYSNLGYIVVGAAIERLTGHDYETALTDEILRPLGISSAGFGAPTGSQPWGHHPRRVLTSRLFIGGVGRGTAADPATTSGIAASDNPPVMSPAGRLHLALADWARFIRIFIDPDQRMLQPASIATLTTPPPGRGTRQAMGWANAADHRVAFGQQGSNQCWVATALIAADRRSASAVVCNDGRARLLLSTARLATELLPTAGG